MLLTTENAPVLRLFVRKMKSTEEERDRILRRRIAPMSYVSVEKNEAQWSKFSN